MISPSEFSPTLEPFSGPDGQPGDYSSTLETLKSEDIPINDPLDIARRLEGKVDIPLTLPVDDLDRQVGEKESFWVSNTDTAENFQITTTLSAVTDHLYFWIEDGVDYSQVALDRLAKEFEEVIYPINQEFFGSEWFPGVDEDPHLYVIYARGLGMNWQAITPRSMNIILWSMNFQMLMRLLCLARIMPGFPRVIPMGFWPMNSST